jgi:hypothetical protein
VLDHRHDILHAEEGDYLVGNNRLTRQVRNRDVEIAADQGAD